MNKKIFTVSEINKYIKNFLENDVILSDIFIEGEISNLKFHNLGYVYFTLKDTLAAINCIIFPNFLNTVDFDLQNGIKVISYGKINLFEKTGQYKLYIELIKPLGRGEIYIAFDKLKNKLDKKGYFDKNIKKQLPSNPKVLALITSSTGAAVQDMIKITKKRNKNVSLAIIPTLMQGKNSPKSVADSIKLVNKWNKADIIILGRGGGSIEDLDSFNTEIVADAIYNSSIPIVSAIGHETDFTIADFVSDVRASTPSSAIEICVPDINNTKYILNNNLEILSKILYNKYINNREKLNNIYNNKFISDFNNILLDKKLYLYKTFSLINKETNIRIEKENIKINNFTLLLKNISPLKILKRGYSIIYKDNKNIKSIKNLNLNDYINIKLNDGIIKAKICSIKYENNIEHNKEEV